MPNCTGTGNLHWIAALVQASLALIDGEEEGRGGGEGLTNKRHQEAGPHTGAYAVDEQGESGWGALLLRIPAKGVLRLCHADGQLAKALPGVPLDVLLCLL